MSTKTKEPKKGTYQLQRGMGNGCFMDPPGYPTYYTRSVYNLSGNGLEYDGAPNYFLPARELGQDGARYELAVDSWFKELDEVKALFRPLPEDHDRTRAWVKHVYQHLGRCYNHPTKTGRGEIFVWPDSIGASLALIDQGIFEPKKEDCLACCFDAKTKKYLEAHKTKTAEFNAWCTPERHRAVKYIREFYPDHAARLDLIANSPTLRGSWYSTAEEWPAADACPGDTHVNLKHIAGRWCQWCGRDGGN